MLAWISETAFESAFQDLRRSAQDALNHADKRRQKNVVDPFLTLLLSSTFAIENSSELVDV